jgi:hypothetical protein
MKHVGDICDLLFNVFTFFIGMVVVVIILAVAIPYAAFCLAVLSVIDICSLACELFWTTVEVAFGDQYCPTYDDLIDTEYVDDSRQPLTQDEVMNLANANYHFRERMNDNGKP